MPESDRNQSSQPGNQQPMTHSRTQEPGSESPRPRSASPRSPSPDQDRQLKVKVRLAIWYFLHHWQCVSSELISNGGIGIHRFRIEDYKFCGLQYFGLDLLKLVVVRPIRFNLDFFQERTSDSNQKMTLQSINLHGTPANKPEQ